MASTRYKLEIVFLFVYASAGFVGSRVRLNRGIDRSSVRHYGTGHSKTFLNLLKQSHNPSEVRPRRQATRLSARREVVRELYDINDIFEVPMPASSITAATSRIPLVVRRFRELEKVEDDEPFKLQFNLAPFLMVGTVLNGTLPKNTKVEPGDNVLYIKRHKILDEFYIDGLDDDNRVYGVIRDEQIIATYPNSSFGPDQIPEMQTYGNNLLLRWPIEPVEGSPIRSGLPRTPVWGIVHSAGSVFRDYSLSEGDYVQVVPDNMIHLGAVGDYVYCLTNIDMVVTYAFKDNKIKVPFGDGMIVEPHLLGQDAFSERFTKLSSAVDVGRIAGLGTGLADQQPPGSPGYVFRFKVGDYVLYDQPVPTVAKFWDKARPGESGYNDKYSLRYHIVKDSMVKAKLPDVPIDDLLLQGSPNIRALEPATDLLLVYVDSEYRTSLDGSLIRPGPIEGMLPVEIVRLGSMPVRPQLPRRPASDWIDIWKAKMNISRETPKIWIEKWRRRTKLNMTDEQLSARRWIDRWKFTRVRDPYKGLKAGDIVLTDFSNFLTTNFMEVDFDNGLYAIVSTRRVVAKLE